jgi:hypothetical protein
MKKFSNISNAKVGQEPEVKEVKLNEEDIFRSKVVSLMDSYLRIQTYGPVDRFLRAGTLKISGKEMFAEALLTLISDKSLKEQSAILESLKSTVRDWESIDEKIDQLNSKIEETESKNKMIEHRDKLVSLFERYGKDEEILLKMVESSSEKIKTSEKAHMRSLTAEYMSLEGKYPKEVFVKISEKYKHRADQLCNNK